MSPVRKPAKQTSSECLPLSGLEGLIELLRSHGVLAFSGYGVQLALSPGEPMVTVEFEPEEKSEERAATDLYSNPALWGPSGRPDFE
jgi:hypothetical protein